MMLLSCLFFFFYASNSELVKVGFTGLAIEPTCYFFISYHDGEGNFAKEHKYVTNNTYFTNHNTWYNFSIPKESMEN